MKLLLILSAVLGATLAVAQNFGNPQPTNFQQSQNFNSDQFQTQQFQSQGFQQQAQQQQIKLQPSSNLGQSNQYLPPQRNNPPYNNRNNADFNNRNNANNAGSNNNNNRNNPNNPGFNNQNRGSTGPGFQQHQAQSINIEGSQFQGNQAQQAYGNKQGSQQNQHQNQQGIFQPSGSGYPKNQQGNFQPSGSGYPKNNPNRNQNYRDQNKQNQGVYHSESHSAASAASASSSSKYEHHEGGYRKQNSQYNVDENIIRNEASPDGAYSYSYDTSDGTSVEQSGYIKNPGARSDDKILSVKGSYSYIAPEGDRISVSYVADENGYRATTSKT